MNFRTPVTISAPSAKIEHAHALMFLGSCFSESIGDRFLDLKFQTSINPFGTIYNPISVSNALKSLLYPEDIDENMLVEHDGMWHSFLHHGKFSTLEKQDLINNLLDSAQKGNEALLSADWLFITFGTSWVYEWTKNGQIVSNCHKFPAVSFNRYRLDIDEIVTLYKELLVQLFSSNPKLQVVFTVSPVRHLKDGAHENQLSKSVLLLAVDQLCQYFDKCQYFPSYELILDDLRDYRFYKTDMIHISDSGVDYVWERLSEKWFSDKTGALIKDLGQIIKAAAHRPFNPKDPKHLSFVKNTIDKITRLQQSYPYLKMNQELNMLTKMISVYGA